MTETFIVNAFAYLSDRGLASVKEGVKNVDLASMMGMLQGMLQGLMSGSLSITGMLQGMLTGLLGKLGL